MGVINDIRDKASRRMKTIVLPESDDPRTLDAVNFILEKRLAKLILVGKEEALEAITAKERGNLTLIDPCLYPDLEKFSQSYYEARKAKGMTPEEAREAMMKEYVTFGAMLVKYGIADGFVAGANHTTPDVIRAALRCIPIDRTIGVVSGAFLMELPDREFGENGVFVFADCGVNPDPNARQLAGIAVSAAALFKSLVGAVPRVALLSYSSKGSAAGGVVQKVVDALKKAKEIAPDVAIDGEFQLDSAVVSEVAKLKCPASDVAGRANVLIFPDLNSGNISYKLTQRLARARAVGPLFLGFTKPCSDLSRGCTSEDIVDAVCITSVRV